MPRTPRPAFRRSRGRAERPPGSSDHDDLDVYLRIFGTIRHLRKRKVIVVVPGRGHDAPAADFAKHDGTTFRFMTFADLKTAFDGVDAAQAEKAAKECVRGTPRVVEPSPQDVLQGVRFYLGVKRLLEREDANAITVDCLGGIHRRELPGYPCLAWSRLDDEGLYSVCQADLQCAMTQLLLTSPERNYPIALRGADGHARDRRAALALHPAFAPGNERGAFAAGPDERG